VLTKDDRIGKLTLGDETLTVEIHTGEMVHAMDHLVLDLAGPDHGSVYFTIYSLTMMRDVGPGLVALMRVETTDDVVDLCFGETTELAERMQHRLRNIDPDGPGLEHAPLQASIRRLPAPDQEMRWIVESAEHTVSAHWSAAEPAFWLSAPAPTFHPTRDYATVMVGYRQAELVIDGRPVQGEPYDHAFWEERLERPFSSCHAALAETAVEAR
jgi:hypothetical protein